MRYGEIKSEIEAAPMTWLPGLLVCVVKASLKKKVFKPGGAARIASEVEIEFLGQPESQSGGSLKQPGSAPTTPSRCEMRPGIGLCDECSQPKWPQEYMGYGCMVCLDCLDAERKALNAALSGTKEKL